MRSRATVRARRPAAWRRSAIGRLRRQPPGRWNQSHSDGGEQRERIPLHHVDPVGFDAEIRRRPRAGEPIVGDGCSRRLDHHRQYGKARRGGKSRRVEVLPDRTARGFALQARDSP